MRQFYTFGLLVYASILRLLSPYSAKAKLWVDGRKNLFLRLKEEVEPGYLIWIHAASVGEFEQARPLIEKIKSENPHKKILVTFYSPSGFELRKNYPLADYIHYMPLDTPKNAQRFLNLVQPEMVFFIKYEFWYNFIDAIGQRQIPLYLVSGIFRPSQLFFKPYGHWFSKHLAYFKHFFIQDISSAKLLTSIGIKNISITGDTRFDRVYSNAQQVRPFDDIARFTNGSKTLICGSTWPQDEKYIHQYLVNTSSRIKLIIAPHEVHESHLQNIENRFKDFAISRWSQLSEVTNLDNYQIVLIDSVGSLMHLYQYAQVAYVGGGFGVGIHNILEAACFGKPVFFGPNYTKFKEAIDLIELGGAVSFRTQHQLDDSLSELLNNQLVLSEKSAICTQYVEANYGATEKIYTHCFG